MRAGLNAQSTDKTLTDQNEDTGLADAGDAADAADAEAGTTPETAKALEAAMNHHRNGDLAGARAAYEAVLEAEPQNPDAHHLIGMIAYQTGNAEAAIEHIQQAIAAQPENPHFHLNYGEALRAIDQIDGAMAAYRRAVALDNTMFEAHTNLGLLAFENSYVGEGIESLRHAVNLQPANPGAQNNLGLALRQVNNFDAALTAFSKAVVIAPEQAAYRQNFIETLEGGPFIKAADSVRQELEAAYLSDGIDHQSLNPAAIALIRREEVYQGVLALTDNDGANDDVRALADAVAGGVIEQFMIDPLVRGMMTRTIITDPDFERIFTKLRRVIIEEGVAPKPPESAVGRQPQFVAALAMQAFNSGYAWREMQGEAAIVSLLVAELSKSIDAITDGEAVATPLWSGIMVAACYRALHQFAAPEKLLSTDVTGLPSFITNLVAQQLAEPALEADMSESVEFIVAGTASETDADELDQTSWPRWSMFAPVQSGTLGDILRAQIPGHQAAAFAEDNVAILVPGCSSGKMAIELAVQHEASLVLGIDPVRANIAYAWRKAMQMEMTNVRFAQGSVDDLAGYEGRFHFIDSSDVLGQTDNVVGTWQTLVDVLEPRGYMRINLFSETGRSAVAAAREVLGKDHEIKSVKDIRAARAKLLHLEDGHPARAVLGARNFYSLKGARDILAPAAESTFTIPSLAATLGQLGLEFLGFDITEPTVVGKYLEMFPKAESLADLDKWQKVEAENPDIFSSAEYFGGYQVWCQKRD